MDNATYEQYQQEQKRRQRIKRKLEKRLWVVREQEKSMQDFEALHSSLISLDESDKEQDTVVTRPLVWRAEEVSTIFQVIV